MLWPARTPASSAESPQSTSGVDPFRSFRSLLDELATQTRNTIALPATNATFDKLTDPTPLGLF